MGLGIVVFGGTLVDIKGYPNAKYIPQGRNAGRIMEVHGGVSRNIAEDIGNVELRPTLITVLDHSGVSDDILKKLQNHKVNTDYIMRTDDGLGTWLAIFDHTGDLVASISKRPDISEITTILKEKGDEIFQNADSIAVEIDMDVNILKQIFELADKYNKKVFAVVSNMSIAQERRDLLKRVSCFVCNAEEAGILFSEDYEKLEPEALKQILLEKVKLAEIKQMVVTIGDKGSIYVTDSGESGVVPSINVAVQDTAGAGDAFFAGVTIGLTYGKNLLESCNIGTRLATSVVSIKENVCPRFLPSEFNIEQ